MFKVRYLNKDVILGIATIIILMVMGIVIIQLGGNNDGPSPTLTADLSRIPRIGVDEVKRKVDRGVNLVIVDTRSRELYEHTHIAGAVSVPLEEVAERYTELKGFDEIITYCT